MIEIICIKAHLGIFFFVSNMETFIRFEAVETPVFLSILGRINVDKIPK